MTARRFLVATHRWLSLIAVAFWLLQAATGIFAVFHWEIDDAMVRGAHHRTDFRAIERSIAGQQVSSIWTSAGAPDRYDVNLSDRTHRIDGAGNVLRVRLDRERWMHGGFVGTLVSLHHDLLAGDRGRMIAGISGLLLLSNVILGVVVAWPRPGQWMRALRPRGGPYGWHRAIGLWVAVPLFMTLLAGVMLAFEATSERLLGGAIDAPSVPSTAPRRISMADAAAIALARYREAEISGISFPDEANAVWQLTLKQRGERRRAYGKTIVFVSAIDGRVLADFDALAAPAGRRVFESLFALHTGEAGGIAGRVAVFLAGTALVTLIVFGLRLWWARRSPPI